MTRFKDFGGGTADDIEPISFKLYDEEFNCVKQVQGKVLINIVAAASDSDPAASLKIINTFFEAVMYEESYIRFEALLDDKERIVTVETLGDITSWLIEEYSNRPNQQPED